MLCEKYYYIVNNVCYPCTPNNEQFNNDVSCDVEYTLDTVLN